MFTAFLTLGFFAFWWYTRPNRKIRRIIYRIHKRHRIAMARLEQAHKALQLQMSEADTARHLEHEVVADCLRREARAKAVVKALLGLQGASDVQVARVIAEIDNAEEGDVR